MLLYFQPVAQAEERRCFLVDPLESGARRRGTETTSRIERSQEITPSICVHAVPSIVSVFLSRE